MDNKTAIQRIRQAVEFGKYKAWNSTPGEFKAQSIIDDFHNGAYGSKEGMWVQVKRAVEYFEKQQMSERICESCFGSGAMQMVHNTSVICPVCHGAKTILTPKNDNSVLEEIKALTEVVKVNSGFLGNEKLRDKANSKIQELIEQL